MCVDGAQQEIEPRQPLHVRRSTIKHTSLEPHTRYTKHTAVAKAVARAYNWNAYVPPFRLEDAPGMASQPLPEGKPCTLCQVQYQMVSS